MRLTRLPDRVPQPHALLERDVDFPAKLANIRDARGQRANRTNVDEAAGAKRKALVGDVGIGDRRHQVAGSRTPDADRGPARRQVGELHGAVLGKMVEEPLLVPWPVRAAGHHAKMVRPETHHGEVGLDPCRRIEQRRIDNAPHRHVHLDDTEVLHGVERTGAGDVEDREGGEVDHRHSVAHRQVLGIDDW